MREQVFIINNNPEMILNEVSSYRQKGYFITQISAGEIMMIVMEKNEEHKLLSDPLLKEIEEASK